MSSPSARKLKPYIYSNLIPLIQKKFLCNIGKTKLVKQNIHIIKKIFFDTFLDEAFINLYKSFAKDISTIAYGDPKGTCLQVTPTPRVSFGGSHGTSIHTDYWYGHGKSAFTVWVPILNCISGSTFYSDHYNELGFDHKSKEFSIDLLNNLTPRISQDKYKVLPPESSCYIFNSLTLHGSPLNTTPKTRLSFDFRISKKDDDTSSKDLKNYFQYDYESQNYVSSYHPLFKKSVLKYVSNAYDKSSFVENICINATAEKYGFLISDQEGEIMRYGNPVFEAILNGYSLSKKYSGIVVFSSTIFSNQIIKRIKSSNIKVWACLENKFI